MVITYCRVNSLPLVTVAVCPPPKSIIRGYRFSSGPSSIKRCCCCCWWSGRSANQSMRSFSTDGRFRALAFKVILLIFNTFPCWEASKGTPQGRSFFTFTRTFDNSLHHFHEELSLQFQIGKGFTHFS